MLVLLGALREEIAGLRRQMVIEEASAERDYRIYKGKYGNKSILLGQTGIGKENAEGATKFILERHPAEALICLGFTGALIEGLKVGDVILSTTLYSADEQTQEGLRLRSPSYSDANLVSIATQNQKVKMARFFKGSSVTVANPVSEPKAKLALGKAFRAEVVDMESYWISRIAAVNRIPFLSVRAVSDTVRDTLPPFDQFLNSGQWQWRRAILYFLTHPQQLVNLFCLYRNAQKASRSLTAFMDSFITKAMN